MRPGQFIAGFEFLKKEKQFTAFLRALRNLTGPLRHAADKIEAE